MLRFLVTRPIAVLLTTAGLVVLGFVVLGTLPVSLLPEVPIPQITVQVSQPNIAARELENTVTRSLRHQLMQVGKLRDIRSQTRNGSATITLEFDHGTNTNLAFIETNEKIDQAIGGLPPGIERPRVLKTNVTDIPVFYLSIFEKQNPQPAPPKSPIYQFTNSQLDLATLARNTLRRRIEQLPEVAFVDMSGYAEPQVVISPRPGIFQGLRLTETDLEAILRSSDLELGSVLVQDGHYQYHIRFHAALRTVEDIGNIYFRHGGQVLQLRDVAEVSLRPSQRQGMYLFNGQEAIVFSVRKKADTQLFSMKKSFGILLEELRRDFPQLEFAVSNDQSELLEVSVSNLRTSLLWGAFFAFAVLFLFFREWRSPLLIGVVVPVSLIVALFGFYFTGTSVNVISLSGLILGVGLMIDNGIIVMENVRQFRRMGHGHTDACVLGANEVIRPLLSSALTTCSVFVPLVFLSGVGGALFRDQALSVSLALGASLLVAYVALPTILNLGKKQPSASFLPKKENAGWYEKTADLVLRYPWLALFIFLSLAAGAAATFLFLKKETFPPLTRQGIAVHVDWNEAVSVEASRERLLGLLAETGPLVQASGIFIGRQQFLLSQEEQGMNEAQLLLFGSPGELADRIPAFFKENHPHAVVEVAPLKTLFDEVFGGNLSPLTAHLQPAAGSGMPELQDVTSVAEALEKQGIEVSLPPLDEQLEVEILREEALRYGTPGGAIYSKLRTLFSQHPIGRLRTSGQHIPIVSGTEAATLQSLVSQAQLQNEQGSYVPLSSFVRFRKIQSLKTLTAGKSGESLDLQLPVFREGLQETIRDAAGRTGRLAVHFSGQVFENERVIGELAAILGISLLLLYLILAAQFESLVLPFIVILTVPLGMAGALLTLWLAGQSLNLVSIIGLIVMGGIVVNDAILKVDMMNRQSKTMPLREAIHLAGQRRLRPIVMTSATTVLALLPVLFSGGLGAELQQPLAWAVLGGLTAGTIASLYFVPVVYFLIKSVKLGRQRASDGK